MNVNVGILVFKDFLNSAGTRHISKGGEQYFDKITVNPLLWVMKAEKKKRCNLGLIKVYKALRGVLQINFISAPRQH